MSQPAAALYIQPPMFETIVATQSIANIRYRKAASGDAPVVGFCTATGHALLDAARDDLYCRLVKARRRGVDVRRDAPWGVPLFIRTFEE
jgi:hypothetical protein